MAAKPTPMMSPPFDAVYTTHWSLADPLTESQSLPVLRALAGWGYRMGLITYERSRHTLSGENRETVAKNLENEGITWFPLPYHRRPPSLSTAWDVWRGLMLARKVHAEASVRLFHSRGTVPAASASLAAKWTGARFFYDADGPLSQEYADIGIWAEESWLHRLVRRCERSFFTGADRAAVLTTRRRDEVRSLRADVVRVIPCGVDVDHFDFRPEARDRLRRHLGLNGIVFVYAGKWGGWYAVEEMLDFFRVARDYFESSTLLILTHDSPEMFISAGRARDIDSDLIVRGASRDQMPDFLSAADVGLSVVRPLPSKTACSPVKNGEYLACGLPLITPAGIGDYSDFTEREQIGVVLRHLDERSYSEAVRNVERLLGEPDLRKRCREAVRREAGLREVVLPLYRSIYEELLGSPGRDSKGR